MGDAPPHDPKAPALLGAFVQCTAAAVLFGASTPAAKPLLGNGNPCFFASALYLGAALAMLPALVAQRRQPLGRASAVAKVAVAVVVGGAVAPVLMLFALARAPAADVSIWLGFETVFTGVLGHLFFREQLGAKAWLANACVVLAGCLVALPAGWHAAPALLAAGACLGWALDNNLSASLVEVSPERLVALKGFVGGGLNLGCGLLLAGAPPHLAPLFGGAAIGSVGYGVSLLLYLRGARRLGAARSQMVFASAPLAGVVVSWAVLGEPLRSLQLAAVATLGVGLFLLFSERHAHEHLHEAVVHSHEHRHDDGHHLHPHEGLPTGALHTHEHAHVQQAHSHPHLPDPHHRHSHR